MQKKKTLIVLILIGALLIGIVSVFVFMSDSRNLLKNKPLVTVTFAPKWVHQAQFAGMYTAIEKGFYQKRGLAVEFSDYNPRNAPFKKIQSGEADFGLMNASGVLKEVADGEDVLALAVFY